MEKGLTGKRVAICGSRKIEELTILIEKQGGIALSRPLQGTVFLSEEEVKPDLIQFIQHGADWIIFTTGIGIETLQKIASNLGIEQEFISKIRAANVASRGYKTLAALKRLTVVPAAVAEDGTTKDLIQALESFDFHGNSVTIQLHGETAPLLTSFFEDRGANVHKLLPYQHLAPDPAVVALLCKELINQECDAVCFTTAVQVRSLFDFAREHDLYSTILECFANNSLAVAVGKVTAEALREEGVERVITPENERMGAMVVELSRHYSRCL
ncbi:uroporphyrinogen-III synthase [Neobacillus dielmonensis]|uniref:uroporphyrinogen-III synthase n=1 Tax=Neobacillus dielmonensis TaxID=1347369 RepID=UPI0005A92F54|nr:uroporphyrinogen-III synthase [Neobacillus dielmonensis]